MPVHAKESLSPQEVNEVTELRRACEQEGLKIPLAEEQLGAGRGRNDHFLFYRYGALVGYLGLQYFCPEEVEVIGMVHPDFRRRGVFSALLEAARKETTERGFRRMLLTVERRSEGGQALARRLSERLEHTEHLLVLGTPRPRRPAGSLEVAELEPDAVGEVEAVERESYGDFVEKPWARRLVGRVDGRAVGKIDVDGGAEACLSGFVVLPQERRKGYGRQLLQGAVDLLLSEGIERVVIEVETTNANALALYESVGFVVATSYDYYEIALKPGPGVPRRRRAGPEPPS